MKHKKILFRDEPAKPKATSDKRSWKRYCQLFWALWKGQGSRVTVRDFYRFCYGLNQQVTLIIIFMKCHGQICSTWSPPPDRPLLINATDLPQHVYKNHCRVNFSYGTGQLNPTNNAGPNEQFHLALGCKTRPNTHWHKRLLATNTEITSGWNKVNFQGTKWSSM